MKKIIFASLILFFLVEPQSALAKILPQAKRSEASTSRPSPNVVISPRLRRDRQALVIYFGGLQNATSVSYTLTYETNGKQEGVIGTINLGSARNATRELLFGTCSKNVCRYHTNITNMKLEIPIQTKSGRSYTKRYRIRV